MGDRRVRAFRRWRAKAATPATGDTGEMGATTEDKVPEPVAAGPATGPVLADPLPQRRRVAAGERAAPAEGSDIRDIAAMMDYLRREN